MFIKWKFSERIKQTSDSCDILFMVILNCFTFKTSWNQPKLNMKQKHMPGQRQLILLEQDSGGENAPRSNFVWRCSVWGSDLSGGWGSDYFLFVHLAARKQANRTNHKPLSFPPHLFLTAEVKTEGRIRENQWKSYSTHGLITEWCHGAEHTWSTCLRTESYIMVWVKLVCVFHPVLQVKWVMKCFCFDLGAGSGR